MSVGPEPLAGCLGGLLYLSELAPLVVLHVPPGETIGDLLPVDVGACHLDVRDDPAVAVLVDLLDIHNLALDQIPEGLPGDVSERLGLFRGVDAVEPDFDSAVLSVAAGKRVADGDRDDLEMPGERGGGEGQGEQQR